MCVKEWIKAWFLKVLNESELKKDLDMLTDDVIMIGEDVERLEDDLEFGFMKASNNFLALSKKIAKIKSWTVVAPEDKKKGGEDETD